MIMSPLRPVTMQAALLVEPAEVAGAQAPPSALTVAPETRISPSSVIATPTPGSGRPAVSRSPGSATVTVEQACVSP